MQARPPRRRWGARARGEKTRPAASSFCGLPPAERVEPGIISERLNQHAVKPEFGRLSELRDADGHTFVPGRGLGAIGAEQPIPPRQVEAECCWSRAERQNG